MGNYGEILMTTTWYNNLNDNIKSHFIADASRTSHYFWHIYSRMNWGEPWYAGFRESQTEYRFKNQKYFARNLMPGMLGWFRMTNQTSIEDIEWMLAKAAGYNAGFGFVCSYKSLEENGQTDKILKKIKIWEQARLQGAFNDEIREQLRNTKKEFQLVQLADNEWELTQITPVRLEHSRKVRQPGEPLFSKITFNNPSEKQNLNFILSAIDGNVQDIKMEIDGYKEIVFHVTLQQGETIKYEGGDRAVHYSKNNDKIEELNLDLPFLTPGEHSLTLDCTFPGEKETKLKLEIRIFNKRVNVTVK
jgi:hypothetical protein